MAYSMLDAWLAKNLVSLVLSFVAITCAFFAAYYKHKNNINETKINTKATEELRKDITKLTGVTELNNERLSMLAEHSKERMDKHEQQCLEANKDIRSDLKNINSILMDLIKR